MPISICPDCGLHRNTVKNTPIRLCKSCSQKKAQTGRVMGNQPHGKKCFAKDCENNLKRDNVVGYCYKCFHANVDGVKTADQARRLSTLEGRLKAKQALVWNATEADMIAHEAKSHCDYCEKELVGSDKCFDHCHTTGTYRGTLCKRCNGALGNLGDDLDLIITKLRCYSKGSKL